MGILADWQIKNEIWIHPMVKKSKPGELTSGLSSYGYDARCGRDYKVFTNVHSTLIDPKNFDTKSFVDFFDVDFCIIPPNSFALARTMESFKIPRDILAVCLGKSTLARLGIVVNVTPLEPEWQGTVTIEISNTTPLPCKIYSGEGIMQILFFRADNAPCEVSYKDKRGRYQGQTNITLPFVEGNKDENKT